MAVVRNSRLGRVDAARAGTLSIQTRFCGHAQGLEMSLGVREASGVVPPLVWTRIRLEDFSSR